MSKDIETLLKEAAEDVLTPETLQAITECFNTAVEQKVESLVKESTQKAVDAALAQVDEEHSALLSDVLVRVDEDHTAKLNTLVERLDESYASKLEHVVNHYEKQITESAEQFKEQMINRVSAFIDLAIEESIPSKMVEEAVQNTRSRKIMDEIRKMVSLDEAFINDNVRAALQDGRKQIDESKNALAEALKQNALLTEQNSNLKTKQILLEKTANLPAAKKEYVLAATKGKDARFIVENFESIVKMYEREDAQRRELIRESATKEAVARIPDATPIAKEESRASGTAMYLDGFKAFK